jgi:hypothetical protein
MTTTITTNTIDQEIIMSSEEGRIHRGQLSTMVYDFLKERGPLTLTQLAHGMAREGSNLYVTLKRLETDGKIVQNYETKIWRVIGDEVKSTPTIDGEGAPEPEQEQPPSTAPPTDSIEAAIQALKDTGKQQRKIARVRELLTKALAVLDGE